MKITINKKSYESIENFVLQGRGCATTRPNHYQINRNDERIANSRFLRRPESVDIQIHFVHFTDGVNGFISESQRIEQINILNSAYNSFGILSISVEKLPPVSVQKFPHGLVGYSVFNPAFLCLNR